MIEDGNNRRFWEGNLHGYTVQHMAFYVLWLGNTQNP